MGKYKKVEIQVHMKPTHISFECPHCENDIEIKYDDFCDMVGEPCDWTYSVFECPECGESVEINSVDWG